MTASHGTAYGTVFTSELAIIDESYMLDADDEISTEEKVELLAKLICQVGSPIETRSAALLVLMSTRENSEEPKLLANHLKHLAFTQCGELNCYGMVDAQIAIIESELLAGGIRSQVDRV